MHYYTFNIGDYHSHTSHLSEIEDIAYRRMMDWMYLHESPLPNDADQIARLIRMRSHSESIAIVLREFFDSTEYGYTQKHVISEIEKFRGKSEKAKASAEARWSAKPIKSNANALKSQSEGNTNQEPLTINQEPRTTLKDITPSAPTAAPKKSLAIKLDYSQWPSMPSEQTMTDWLAMRKRLKANVSQTVINRFSSELRKAVASGYSVDQCLAECVTRNWRGFDAQWLLNSKQISGAYNEKPRKLSLAERTLADSAALLEYAKTLPNCDSDVAENGAAIPQPMGIAGGGRDSEWPA